MKELTVFERPTLREPCLVFAFAGWPDAGEAASGAVRYLINKLGARKFAELDPEGFYDFTVMRPLILSTASGQREVRWPSVEFFYARSGDTNQDLVFFLAIEPSFRWRTFTSAVLGLAQSCGANTVVGLGALLDNVPHTREPRVTGGANRPDLQARLSETAVATSEYQGPTGIHSAIYNGCQQRGMGYATFWGHAPYYIRSVANPKVSLALLRRLCTFLGLPLDLAELEQEAEAFDLRLKEALLHNPELGSLVQRLEEQEEPPSPPSQVTPEPFPGADAVVEELEEFLRRRPQPEEGA